MASPFAVFLKDAQLRQLANVIRLREIQELQKIRFPNLGEQLLYLRMVNENVTAVETILDECNLIINRYRSDSVRSSIATRVLTYAEHCLNNALQLVCNYTLRKDYLEKMNNHLHQLEEALETLDSTNNSAAAQLTESVLDLDQTIVAYMLLNLNKHASREFSFAIRNSGIAFDQMVRNHQTHLGFAGKFEDLEDEQKLEVYTEVIDVSGRFSGLTATRDGKGDVPDIEVQRATVSFRNKKALFGSAAMFLMDMGIIIWEVYSAGHTMTEAVRAAVIAAAEAGGAALGSVVGAAVAKMVGVAAASIFGAALGLIFGFIGAFIFGAVAGLVFDSIFSSGGEKDIPEQNARVYVSEMPNGQLLARQIYALN